MQKITWIVFLLIGIVSCSGTKQKPVTQETVVTKPGSVDAQLAALSLDEKIGQMFAPAYRPDFYGENNAYFSRYLDLVKKYHIGGVTFYRGEANAVARCIDRLQNASKIPLLVMADVEWGIPHRIEGGTRFLQNMAIGATGSETYAYEMGKITALEAKAMGIHLAYSPVMDVNNNPDNIIINTRSYGEDPELVGRLGAAFIRGMQAHGVYATTKHYPGHGDTDVDSHLGLPVINAPQERIRSVELAPFRAAVDAGVKSVMVSHITYSAFPQMEGRPATLDNYFIQDVLREDMGFEGLLITDAMDMGGITRNYWSGEAAVMAINAGVDIVLLPPNFETTFQFVLNAAKSGRIAMSRIDEAVRRILAAKVDLNVAQRRQVDMDRVEKVVANPAHLQKSQEIADAAMTLLRDEKDVFPMAAENLDSVFAVTITDVANASRYGVSFNAELRKRIPFVKTAFIDPRSDEAEIQRMIETASKAQAVVVGVFVKWGSHKGSVSLPDTTVELLKNFFEIDKPMAVVSFGSPYVLRQIPYVPSYLCAYETVPVAVRSAVKAIFGEIPISAKLPVSIPSLYEIGDGLSRNAREMTLEKAIDDAPFSEAYQVLETAMADSVFPGAQVAIVHDGKLLASHGFGRQTYAADAPKIDTKTIYDLASVTKVAATTVVAMQLWEKGKISLNIPVKSYLPKFNGGDKDRVTLQHLFTHSSGVHWWADLWNQAENKAGAIDYIYRLPLNYAPGDSMIYSDLGLIMIGEILETVTGKRIHELAASRIYQPMGMENTMFTPPESLLPRIVPTEIGGSMNRGLIHRDVHDENTHFFRGISTHAGLFSTAEDLAALAQMLLNGGIYRHHRFFAPQTIKKWTSRQHTPVGSIRALGWTTPYKGSLAGSYFSPGSFGHTGYTGTSLWVDPNRKIAVVLLTNRVHPTRERGGIGKVRRDFHDAVMKALIPEDKLGKLNTTNR